VLIISKNKNMDKLMCLKCEKFNVVPTKVLIFKDGTTHFMGICDIHGTVLVPQTEENIKIFDLLPKEESKQLRIKKIVEGLHQRDIWDL